MGFATHPKANGAASATGRAQTFILVILFTALMVPMGGRPIGVPTRAAGIFSRSAALARGGGDVWKIRARSVNDPSTQGPANHPSPVEKAQHHGR
jgi:hypothetical protein